MMVRSELARAALLVSAFALLLLVGISAPNAATPDLGDAGWAPGVLIPVALGPWAVSIALWVAYALGALAVICGLWRARALPSLPGWATPALALGGLLVAPFGSGDHLNYAAYGRMITMGVDPWLASADQFASDPVIGRVEAPWREEPSVYGPFAVLVNAIASSVGGENLRVTVWMWQIVVVASWLAVRWLLREMVPDRRGLVDVLWTANPLIYAVGVLGAHVDILAAALVLAAIWSIARTGSIAGAVGAGVFVALAGSTKFTYAVAGLAIAIGLSISRHRDAVRPILAMTGAALVLTLALHLWAGPNVYEQLRRSSKAISLASPLRFLLDAGADRWVLMVMSALSSIVLALCLLRLVDRRIWSRETALPPLTLTILSVLAGGYSLAAGYALPWYDLLWWSGLAAVSAGHSFYAVAITRLVVICIAYVPGRIHGLSPDVQKVTMGLRAEITPWLQLAIWLALIVVAVTAGSWPWAPQRANLARDS